MQLLTPTCPTWLFPDIILLQNYKTYDHKIDIIEFAYCDDREPGPPSQERKTNITHLFMSSKNIQKGSPLITIIASYQGGVIPTIF